MGVPRPAYLMSGHDPREPAGTVAESWGDDAFFDFLALNDDAAGVWEADAKDMERERMGEVGGGEGVLSSGR